MAKGRKGERAKGRNGERAKWRSTLLIVEKGVEKNGEMAETFSSETFSRRQNKYETFPSEPFSWRHFRYHPPEGLILAALSVDKGKCGYLGGISGGLGALRGAPRVTDG